MRIAAMHCHFVRTIGLASLLSHHLLTAGTSHLSRVAELSRNLPRRLLDQFGQFRDFL